MLSFSFGNCIVGKHNTISDLYADWLAPELKDSLLVQTWRNGRGTKLPSYCGLQYTVNEYSFIDKNWSFGQE